MKDLGPKIAIIGTIVCIVAIIVALILSHPVI